LIPAVSVAAEWWTFFLDFNHLETLLKAVVVTDAKGALMMRNTGIISSSSESMGDVLKGISSPSGTDVEQFISYSDLSDAIIGNRHGLDAEFRRALFQELRKVDEFFNKKKSQLELLLSTLMSQKAAINSLSLRLSVDELEHGINKQHEQNSLLSNARDRIRESMTSHKSEKSLPNDTIV
jgi:hypothetical protein